MPASEVPVAAMVEHCSSVLADKLAGKTNSGIVVGCGTGDEVVYLRRAFQSRQVFGVDVGTRFSELARAERCILKANALSLPFQHEAFDFAAAFHSLEHVGDAHQALAEIARVLRPGGWFYVGVPNRTRVLGYLGSFDATLWQKITWNLTDWRARLRGKFHNEAGAHAGFDRNELTHLLEERFGDVQVLTEEFLRFKYAKRVPAPVLSLLLSPGVINFSAPAHYALCRKSV
jgi:SAM-dependent methyltransferase